MHEFAILHSIWYNSVLKMACADCCTLKISQVYTPVPYLHYVYGTDGYF